MINNTECMIDINFITQIFPNIKKIRINVSNKFTFTDDIIRYLYYENLGNFYIRSLPKFEIEFCFDMKLLPYDLRDKIVSELQADFDNLGWAVSYGANQESDVSVCFTKINAEPNPNYRPISAALRTPSFDLIDS